MTTGVLAWISQHYLRLVLQEGLKVANGLSYTFENVSAAIMSSTQDWPNDKDEIYGDQKSAAFVVLSTTGPKVAITFGSKFEGSDGVIFSGSDGTGFDATNSGAIA